MNTQNEKAPVVRTLGRRMSMARGRQTNDQLPVVCIGMSSGAVAPLRKLFQHLSPTTHLAFVVIHHLQCPTLLPVMLSSCTAMPVDLASANQALRPNHVYVIPSGKEIRLADGFFSLQPRSKFGGWTNVFTLFLNSLSNSHHPGVAVVLSGLDEDGAAALKTLREKGGITIAQAPESAAIKTGCVDYVLAPDAIATQLEKIAEDLEDAGNSRL